MAKQNFKDMKSLNEVQKVVNEASTALNDKTRTIKTSTCPAVLTGALGAGVGTAVSFGALATAGSASLAVGGAGVAAAVGTGVAAVGAGTVAIVAAPIVAIAGIGVAIGIAANKKKIYQEKLRLYEETVAKQNALIEELKRERGKDKERIDYLTSLVNALTIANRELAEDLQAA